MTGEALDQCNCCDAVKPCDVPMRDFGACVPYEQDLSDGDRGAAVFGMECICHECWAAMQECRSSINALPEWFFEPDMRWLLVHIVTYGGFPPRLL